MLPNTAVSYNTVPPALPSKFDIIPIHNSDVANYLRCRRYWDWTSPARNNLRRRVDIYGLNTNLWFGTGIHYALESYYTPGLSRDPVESFNTWWHIQMEGGEVSKDWLELSYDNEPFVSPRNPELFVIDGLWNLLPNPDPEEFNNLLDLGIGMMTFYKDYAKRVDDFEIIAAESQFSIPLGIEAVDVREQSPNYGQKLEVHLRGKRDGIYRQLATGKYGIIDHKTAAVIGDDYFEKLESDPQCSTYILASVLEAKQHDLPYQNIDEVLYQALRKVKPQPPTMLKSGFPSLSRTTESTTAKLFQEYIVDHGLQSWYDAEIKAQNYYEYLLMTGDENFVIRRRTRRSAAEINNWYEQLRMIATEMLSPDLAIYPNFRGDYLCTRCAFRSPCLAKQDDSGSELIIREGYERNKER